MGTSVCPLFAPEGLAQKNTNASKNGALDKKAGIQPVSRINP